MYKRESAKLRKTIVHVSRKLGLDRKMNIKIKKSKEKFKERTRKVSDDAWDLRDFLMLLDIAEYDRPLGKSEAIMFSFKLGYLAGRKAVEA